jgi:hypothetical protein
MSTLREAAQQALEALEKSRVFVTTREKIKHPEGTEWYDGTITALRAALAQEEGRMEFNVKETVCAKCGSTNGAHSHDCPVAKAALAQQEEQEPVEIKPPNPEGATQCIVRWFAETPAGWVGAWDREALERFTAHPPRREWRGLTDQEIRHFAWNGFLMAEGTWDKDTEEDLLAFARAVEAALKERNA